MAADEVTLEWKNYSPTVAKGFENLYEDTDFIDVTIACEGNRQINAHKVVLQACSKFFS